MHITQLLQQNPLFVFALNDEAAHQFAEYRTLLTGVGKINAAYHLTKAIGLEKPSIIVNLGSAGSSFFQKGEVVCCTRFLQRDMDATALGFERYQTPFSGQPALLSYGIVLSNLPHAICGSGDNFDTSHGTTDYSIVDMEAFALASVAQREGIPFLCLKYISDGADDAAAEEWAVTVHRSALALKAAMDTLF
jgi:adenosylhomocysteine nucleosidase